MIYFKSVSGEVFAYENNEDRDRFGPSDLRQMTKSEVDSHLSSSSAPSTREDVERMRRIAYADPITGSDPLYIEYQRAIATGEAEDLVDSARGAWLTRADEIASKYPWPEE